MACSEPSKPFFGLSPCLPRQYTVLCKDNILKQSRWAIFANNYDKQYYIMNFMFLIAHYGISFFPFDNPRPWCRQLCPSEIPQNVNVSSAYENFKVTSTCAPACGPSPASAVGLPPASVWSWDRRWSSSVAWLLVSSSCRRAASSSVGSADASSPCGRLWRHTHTQARTHPHTQRHKSTN